MPEKKTFKYNKDDVVAASKNWGVPDSPRNFHPMQDSASERAAHNKLVVPHQEKLGQELREIKKKFRDKPDRHEGREEAIRKAQDVFCKATTHSFAGLVFAPWETGYRFVQGQKYKIIVPGDYPELFEDVQKKQVSGVSAGGGGILV